MFLLLLILILSVIIYYKFVKPCFYWKEKGIPHIPSWPLVGSMGKVLLRKQHFSDVAVDLYNKFSNNRYAGYMQFTKQILLIRDLELIKEMAIKDVSHFTDHIPFARSESDPLISKSLPFLNGDKWKDMRSILSAAFTSHKMKNMYVLIEECSQNFVNHFREELEVDVQDLFSKFSNDVIASTAFGIQINSLKEPNNEFFVMGTMLTDFTTWQMIKSIITQVSTTVTKIFEIEIFPKHVTSFFRNITKDNIRRREMEGIVRPDIIHLLLEARKEKLRRESSTKENLSNLVAVYPSQNTDLTDEHIVAQSMLFFFAGFDTISRTLSFMAYELATNPDVQKKLQEEIDAVNEKYKGKLSYDVLLSMKYLDQVIAETLRLWPPQFETDRLCVKNYLIQQNGTEEKAFLVEEGVAITIPIMALQRDPRYYPEPNRFDPERFNDENKPKIFPGTYLPFGIGPRNCIGSRFALMVIKTLFHHLLSKFTIVPVKKTEIPLKIGKIQFSLAPEKGFWLCFKPKEISTT